MDRRQKRERPLAGLTRRNVMREVTAGVTLLAIAIPLNIGYAQIAGLPPTAGLYALILPSVVFALIATTRQVVASPDAAAAALVASSIGGLAIAGAADYAAMALAQAILSGIFFLLLAFLKLGFVANFLSKPILVGFVGGLALDILVSQVYKMLGISSEAGVEFLQKVADLVLGIGHANIWATSIAGGALVILLLGRRVMPAVPWALIVLIVATMVVALTGAEDAGVDVLGEVPAGPPQLTWPVLDFQTWLLLVPSALALTLVTLAEGLLVIRSYAAKRGYSTSPDRDLAAFGMANISAGATGGFAVGSSTSRTAAMDQAGSRTQLPALVVAVGAVLLLVFGTALLAEIPSPAIGAIVGVAVVPLLGIRQLSVIWRQDKFEFMVGAVCFLVTLLVGAIWGLLVAFVLALVNLTRRAAHPPIDTVRARDAVVVRMAAPLFFANGSEFVAAAKGAVAEAEGVTRMAIDMEAITDVDVTGAESFGSLRDWLADAGVELVFERVHPEALQRLRRLGFVQEGDEVYLVGAPKDRQGPPAGDEGGR